MDHMDSDYGYGLWGMVIVNSLIFIIFAFSFFKPRTKADWRTLGWFTAFIVALFTEMYGFPLTIFLFSGWLAKHYPGIDFLSHNNGHLLHDLLGLKGDPHSDPLHILSNILIVAGFWLLASAWGVLFKAQKTGTLAKMGPYHLVRHPQYDAFTLIMLGFLLQWPTLITLVMFPILVVTYIRLSLREEKAVEKEFGDEYRNYAVVTPRFFPRLSGDRNPAPKAG